jgi:hypothetical protein
MFKVLTKVLEELTVWPTSTQDHMFFLGFFHISFFHHPIPCLLTLRISAEYGETMHEHTLQTSVLVKFFFLAQMQPVSANYLCHL